MSIRQQGFWVQYSWLYRKARYRMAFLPKIWECCFCLRAWITGKCHRKPTKLLRQNYQQKYCQFEQKTNKDIINEMKLSDSWTTKGRKQTEKHIQLPHWISYFTCCYDKISWQKQWKGERVSLGSHLWYSWEVLTAGARAGWSHCIHSQEGKKDECWCAAHFLLFVYHLI